MAVLMAIFVLCEGRLDRSAHIDDITDLIAREHLLEISDEQFEAWRAEQVGKFKTAREEEGAP
jgi:hypothetical protein